MPAEARRAASTFRTIITRLRQRRAGAGQAAAQERGPEAARVQAVLDMHELCVRLYRQRMHREHPLAGVDDPPVAAGGDPRWLRPRPHPRRQARSSSRLIRFRAMATGRSGRRRRKRDA
jgi:hypothetical protein